MKYRLLRHSLVVAVVVFALGVATCGDDDDEKHSEDSKPLPCDSSPNFDDLTGGDYEWFADLCTDVGITFSIAEFRYSADRKRFHLKGTYESDHPPHYLFGDEASGLTCYIELTGGEFEVARDFEHCTDSILFSVMRKPPPTFQGSYETHEVECTFSVRMLPFTSDCEEQPAGEDD